MTKEARKQYMKDWHASNMDKVIRNNVRYWTKQAKENNVDISDIVGGVVNG